jgi:hypothetical protein
MPDGSVISYNWRSLAWAVVGEKAACSAGQLEALADACARLMVFGGVSIERLVGHTDLPNASEDVHKRCPRPAVDMASLRELVRDRVPSQSLLWPNSARDGWAVAAGLVL